MSRHSQGSPTQNEKGMPTMTDAMRIGWIGLGNMGSRMAPRLLTAGHALTVFDTQADRIAPLEKAGATPARSLGEVGESSVVISSVPNDDVLLQVMLGPDGLRDRMTSGSCLIDMSTVSPVASAKVAEALAGRGIAYLRAPVSGSTNLAAEGKLSIFVSGDRAAFDACRPILDVLGRKVAYLGPGEEARVMKLVVNLLVAVTNGALAEALSFGGRHGLDWATMIDTVADSVAASPYVLSKVDALKQRDWTAVAPVALIGKDMDLLLEAGRRAGAYLPLAAATRQVLTAVEGRGDDGLDMAAVVTFFDALAPARQAGTEE